MRVYTLHHPTGADVLREEPVLVKEGFNWPAALFTGLWALWAGLWLHALFILGIYGGLQFALILVGADPAVQLAASAGVSAIIGFCANDWRRAKLERRGFRLQGVVAAADKDDARRRWFDLHAPAGAGPAGL